MGLRRRVDPVRATISARIARIRTRLPVVDHGVRAVRHYSDVFGSQLAAGATYYGFLSFFPLMVIAYAAVGYVVALVPGAMDVVTEAVSAMFPGLIGTGSGQLDLEQIAEHRTSIGLIGLATLSYTGLGWVSGLRTALNGVFGIAREQRRNIVLGKAVDLITLLVTGAVLLATVGVGAAVTGFTGTVAGWLGLAGGALLWSAGLAVGLAANLVLFLVLFRLLPRHHFTIRRLLPGALLAAVGFEVLKQLASWVIGSVTTNPLYGVFAIMVALLVWINYFGRLTVLGACWAATASGPPARAPEPTA